MLLSTTMVLSLPADELDRALLALKQERQLKGMQLQITKGQQVIYNFNTGIKN